MPKSFSAYKGTARCYLTITKIRGGKIFEKTLQNLRYGFRGKVFPVCNITTVRAQKKGSRLGSGPGLAERAPLSDKTQFVGQRYSSLLSDDNKNPRRKNFRKNFAKPPLRLPRQGLSRVQYYNRTGAKKSHRCGLERS